MCNDGQQYTGVFRAKSLMEFQTIKRKFNSEDVVNFPTVYNGTVFFASGMFCYALE